MATSGEWFRSFFDADYLRLLRAETPPERTRAEAGFALRALGLGAGARVLDVPCGFGRHSSWLAGRGLDVVGVDLSPTMVAEARRSHRGPRLRFLRGDMRRLAFAAEFDAVINLFTGFGYFSERENLATLRGFARALRPGGRLLIDHRDPAFLAGTPSRRWWWQAGRLYLLVEADFDAVRGVQRLSLTRLGPGQARVKRRHARLRVYSLAEWRDLFARAGLCLERAYGDLRGARFRPGQGPRLIVAGRKLE